MKFKIYSALTVAFAFVLMASHTMADDSKKKEVLLSAVVQVLDQLHYQPQQMDDEFSEKVFEVYLERLDYGKRFLTQKDIAMLGRYKSLIDDQIVSSSFEFYDFSINIINERMEEAQEYYKEALAKPFSFDEKEKIQLDIDKIDFAANKMELREKWRKSMKYQTLSRLVDMEEEQNETKEDGSGEILSFEELEEKAREKVRKRQDNYFRRLNKIDENDWLSYYVNSILNVYDPHTSYFPPRQKENFDIQMSGRLEGIGAQLQDREGYITVTKIIPGGPSWKQGTLKPEDVILRVAQADGEPVDIVDMRIDDAVKLIRGQKGTEVRLTLKKLDGSITVLPIIRDEVILEESYAKSAIITNDELTNDVGYLYLPKFYADFNKKDGRSCAVDVGIEIEKLQDEGIEEIILDLRNNGGGSLQDVVDMVGLFIEEGPVVQVKSRSGMPFILRDKDPALKYDGELVVLVNSFSASASEILAAAVQDYDRGVVIGSNSTFGKGTVQRFYDLDRVVQGEDDIKPLGSIKLTTQKFYRVNGGATQLKGVAPDIILPDSYSHIDVGEKEHDYAMKWSKIPPIDYDRWPAPVAYKEEIVSKSQERIGNNDVFKLIEENAVRLKEQREESLYSLNMDKFKKQKELRKERSDKYKDLESAALDIQVRSLNADAPAIAADEAKQERVKVWHEDLQKDVYIREALEVLKDWDL